MKVRLTHPLISCICITSYRPQMLFKSIISFDAQNYPNKQLIISYPKNDQESRDLIVKILQYITVNIIVIERDDHESLGIAKNHAIEVAKGEYICIWDDDDLYHYDRILHQYNDMQGKYFQAGVLARVFVYDAVNKQAYHSLPYHWGGSLICRKDLIKTYPYLNTEQLEDSYLIHSLTSQNLLHCIYDSGYLYTLVRHQNNVLAPHNFDFLFQQSEKLDVQSTNYLRQQFEFQYQFS